MNARGKNKEKVGIVINNKMEKSILVRIDRVTTHPVYKRTIKKSNKVMAHDKEKKAKLGDKVKIRETKPLSKNKRWRLVEVMK